MLSPDSPPERAGALGQGEDGLGRLVEQPKAPNGALPALVRWLDGLAATTPSFRGKDRLVFDAGKYGSRLLYGVRYQEPIYLCSYPKSGRTWLRFILGNYLNEVLDLGVDLDLQSLFGLLPNMGFGSQRGLRAFRYFGYEGMPLIVSSHAAYSTEFSGNDTILLLRAIPDVLVSHFFHHSLQVRDYAGDLKRFIRDPSLGLDWLLHYLNSWAAGLGRQRTLLVSYEQMHAEALSTVEKVVAFVGLLPDREAVQSAIEKSSFQRMRQAEVRAGIAGHDYDAGEAGARRVREGVAGGFRKHLDAEDLAYVEDKCAQDLTAAALDLLAQVALVPIVSERLEG